MDYIELFAGLGGIRYGLERVQFKNSNLYKSTATIRNKARRFRQQHNGNNKRLFNCIWSNEINKYACQIYRKNFGKEELYEGDITTYSADEIPDHDLLTGGFPCQAFSIAGKRKGFEDTRGTLFFDIARILYTKRPKYFILENVKGLLSHDNGNTFRHILWILDELGYDVQWQVLNSKDFGVPQNRERVFIVGHLRGQRRPEVFPIRKSDYELIGEPVEQRVSNPLTIQNAGGYNRRGTYVIKDEDISNAIDGNYFKGPDKHAQRTLISVNTNKSQGARIYNPEGLSTAIASQAGGLGAKTGLYDIGNMKIRRLTPIECERLQGFPDNWTKYGIDENGNKVKISDTQRYKCLGNAVTTTVITEIGKRLINNG